MTGLEGILSRIEEEARAQAEALFAAAKEEAQAALDHAHQEGERQAKALLEKAQQAAASLGQRADSAAQLERRDTLLRCKQQLIRQAVSEACASLESAPAPEYFSMILELAARWAQPEAGTLYLNARDLERLPPDFEERLQAALPQGSLTVSRQARPLASGFVLAYGLVEYDCSFPALVQEVYDQLRDQVGSILFSEGEGREAP